jgi:small-conductance mechanosensitive channel
MLSGIFFLAEDAFRLGEYVEVGNIRGTVEGIAIRSLRLRHHRGAVHTLPFGQIPRITNYSRDWVIQKLAFHLSFDADLAKMKKIVKRIGADLLQDPDLGKYFLQPLKMQGVRDMTHDSMIVGVKFMAKADDGQFTLRREIYKRIRDEFAKNGIEFARPQVVVHVPPGVTPTEAAAVVAVASGDLIGAPGDTG